MIAPLPSSRVNRVRGLSIAAVYLPPVLFAQARTRVANVMKAIVGFGLAISIALAIGSRASQADDQFFRDNIAPVLERRCIHCHGEQAPKGNLSLTTASFARKGGDGGPAIVPGKPDESVLLEMISGDKPAMPKKETPLSKDEVARIRHWIETGAVLAHRPRSQRSALWRSEVVGV